MVAAYRETPEDRALAKPYRWYNGQKIDIRWRGGWLTPEGEFHPVDYQNGITHETLAEEHGQMIIGSGSITTRPPLIRIYDVAGWIRISYFEYATFCVELKGSFIGRVTYNSNINQDQLYDFNRRRQRVLLQFVKDYRGFDSYFINQTQHDTYSSFVDAIRNDQVIPTPGE